MISKKKQKEVNKHLFDQAKSSRKIAPKFLYVLMGSVSVFWFLFRIIPKPTRAAYPCVKVAGSFASGFLGHLIAATGLVLFFKKARQKFRNAQPILAGLFFVLCFVFGMFMLIQNEKNALAARVSTDPFPANTPIGIAKGIFPGRVVWVHDPDATNENCDPSKKYNGYYLVENSDQNVIDGMLSRALQSLTGQNADETAWENIFKYFNKNHGKGNVGYQAGEKLFIKVNAVHACVRFDLETGCNLPTASSKHLRVETSPQIMLSVLRQLVYEAGVEPSCITIADPMKNFHNHTFELLHGEFPDVHYLDHLGCPGREPAISDTVPTMFYSDRGTVMERAKTDTFYLAMTEADYLINIPALKGHSQGGVTLFAKNHFGSQTRFKAEHLHDGLIKTQWGGNDPDRAGYGKYRVLVDMMGHKYLGGNTLLFLMDGLWATSEAHVIPEKWKMAPFDNDWCSSIFVSLDHVAISSVCIDFLRAEFDEYFIQWDGVDDHLHQAADPSLWPEGIVYDPENDGTPISSLGVHEHWNNSTDKQYSRNLGTGDGIELVKLSGSTGIKDDYSFSQSENFQLYSNYPNPFNAETVIRFKIKEEDHVILNVYNSRGQKISTLVDGVCSSGDHEVRFDATDLASGVYVYQFSVGNHVENRRMLLTK